MKNILITGGAGFIGSHLADYFTQANFEVVILDNLKTGSKDNLRGPARESRLVVGDIRDIEMVDSLVKDADLVLHMAAALGVENIMSDTLESISSNIYGSEVVLKAASKFDKRIFIASSSEIYGKNPKQPLAEEDDRVIGTPQNFRWSYSDAKAIEEATARVLYLEKGLEVTTIRFFNIIGPRQTGKYGMVVPKFIKSASIGEDIQVYGDGTQTRVFCHVNDAIKGLLSLLDASESIGEVFNIGGIEEISIFELANKVLKLTNSDSKIVKIPYLEAFAEGYEDMARRVPDLRKITKLTGWKPTFRIDETIIDILAKS